MSFPWGNFGANDQHTCHGHAPSWNPQEQELSRLRAQLAATQGPTAQEIAGWRAARVALEEAETLRAALRLSTEEKARAGENARLSREADEAARVAALALVQKERESQERRDGDSQQTQVQGKGHRQSQSQGQGHRQIQIQSQSSIHTKDCILLKTHRYNDVDSNILYTRDCNKIRFHKPRLAHEHNCHNNREYNLCKSQ